MLEAPARARIAAERRGDRRGHLAPATEWHLERERSDCLVTRIEPPPAPSPRRVEPIDEPGPILCLELRQDPRQARIIVNPAHASKTGRLSR